MSSKIVLLFSNLILVDGKIIRDKRGVSKGYGFVDMKGDVEGETQTKQLLKERTMLYGNHSIVFNIAPLLFYTKMGCSVVSNYSNFYSHKYEYHRCSIQRPGVQWYPYLHPRSRFATVC